MDIPVDDKSVVAFTAVIQVGAIAAVLVYFFRDIVRIVTAWGHGLRNREERYHLDLTSSPGGSTTPPSPS